MTRQHRLSLDQFHVQVFTRNNKYWNVIKKWIKFGPFDTMYLVGVINTSTSILQIEVDLILMPQLRGPNWWQNDGDFMWFSRVPLQVCYRTHQPIIPHQSTKNSKSKSLSNFNWEGPCQSDTATDSSALSYSNKKNTKIPEKISSFFF